MHKILIGLALALMLSPLAVSAEPAPGTEGGPPPEVRAKLEALRADAKAALIKALSADHLTKVQASVDQFNAGTLAPPDAVQAIDAVLSPDETKAVLDIQTKLNDARRALFPPPPAMAAPNPNEAQRKPAPDAGRTVLQLLASPEKLKSLRRPPAS
jgi:hypothetical protein